MIDRVVLAKMPDRKLAFVTTGIVTEPFNEDPLIDDLECNGYDVAVVKLITLSVKGNFYNLTIYSEIQRMSFFGNDSIVAESASIKKDQEKS